MAPTIKCILGHSGRTLGRAAILSSIAFSRSHALVASAGFGVTKVTNLENPMPEDT